ncbi:uncharacterized protein TRAVEDRAFT_86038, partial [Trametes versicolor FP-101664 SS1]|uniref:uncharacterized protein n=1 Tax=Trametes versicolor (strain FP-101664) TaxID=717944 RepID=UPI0004623543
PTLPLCGTCFSWGHYDRSCSASTDTCPRCGGNHEAAMHHLAALCCRDRPDKDIVRCAHPPVCRNCHGSHYANDHSCEFYRHRSDWEWFRSRVPSIA